VARAEEEAKSVIFLAPKASNFFGAHTFPLPPAHTPLSPPARARRMSGNMKFKNASGLTSLLKDGYKHYGGLEEAILKNISACKQLAAITRTSLGPDGALRAPSAPPATGGARAGKRRGARRATNLPLNRSFALFPSPRPSPPFAPPRGPRRACAPRAPTVPLAPAPVWPPRGQRTPRRGPSVARRRRSDRSHPPLTDSRFPPFPFPRARASPPPQA
jgi:hypothetical protein